MNDRAQAIGRAERALKALGEHPRSSKKELGHAREQLNACYSVKDSDRVWDAVTRVETMAARRYGVPQLDEQGAPQSPTPSAAASPTQQQPPPSMAAPKSAPAPTI